VLDKRRGRKIDLDSLRVLSLRMWRVNHVAVEPVHPWIRASRNGRGVHHGEGRIDGVMIREDDPGSSQGEVIWHVFRGDIVSAQSIPHKDDDSARRGPCVPLLCSETTPWSEPNERQSAQAKQYSDGHGCPRFSTRVACPLRYGS